MSESIICPNHHGAYDCTPFCRLCEGNQEYTPVVEVEKKVKTRYGIEINDGGGWLPVDWAPYFDTEAEAQAWLEGDHEWDGYTQTYSFEVEEDNE